MCGITGFWDTSNSNTLSQKDNILEEMSLALTHRGPDGHGFWNDVKSGIYLGHRRLSIYDLSSQGLQPMISASGRYVIVFNGSIYNFQEIKKEVINYKWKTNTDTEVILACIENFGLDKALDKFEGMFAIAVWDIQEEKLFLARDRVGEKPLYYYHFNGKVIFGSELSAISKYPNIDLSLDLQSIEMQLRLSYIPAPFSIYKNISKVLPGTIVAIDNKGKTSTSSYWSFQDIAKQTKKNISLEDAKTDFNKLFTKTIKQQLSADVAVGTFLSGGTDSSLVTAFAKSINSNVSSFSIGIKDSSFNEADNAKEVAKILGTNHHELYISEQDILDIVPSISDKYSEPFADSSQLPTYMVSKLAKSNITVALSGDGADEIFAGYNRHKLIPNIFKKAKSIPGSIKNILALTLGSVPVQVYNFLYSPLRLINSQKYNHQDIGDKIHKFSQLLAKKDIEAMYNSVTNIWHNPPVKGIKSRARDNFKIENSLDFMLMNDSLQYLPDDILTKVDRASMSVALECRAPFLDHNLINFAWSLPNELKINQGQGKYLLKKVLEDHLPKELIYQPKKGFGIPIGDWLKGPLLPWSQSLLNKKVIEKYDFLDFNEIWRTWSKHRSGLVNAPYKMWNALMLISWLESNH